MKRILTLLEPSACTDRLSLPLTNFSARSPRKPAFRAPEDSLPRGSLPRSLQIKANRVASCGSRQELKLQFLAPLPVRKIPGIGKVTERALRALGIETVDQIAALPQEKLEKIFGQWGTALYRKARGGDSYEFVVDAEPKSISHNHTFGEDTDDLSV